MPNTTKANFSAVIPAYNEDSRCAHVIEELLKLKELDEIVFVDDGSTDNTKSVVEKFTHNSKFKYISHPHNKGKGAALKTGVNAAKNDIILFLDADLENITSSKIEKIVLPVLNDKVDVSRGSFTRERGRVTEYAVKPMMQILFPETHYKQPISGQVCAKKEFLKKINFEDRYGVDIGILFDAIQEGQRIIEVDIGELTHKANSEGNIAEMSRQVLETMIRKAGLIQHKYKLVVFTLDETLIARSVLKDIYTKLGLGDKIKNSNNQFNQNKISSGRNIKNMAKVLKGTSLEKIEEVVGKAPLTQYAVEVTGALQRRKYKVAIISSNFSPIVQFIAKRLGVSQDSVDCIYLEQKDGILTGKISPASQKRWFDKNGDIVFGPSLKRILRIHKTKAAEAIMVANSPKATPLQNTVGLSIAYNPKNKKLRNLADKTISVLAEILALVE